MTKAKKKISSTYYGVIKASGWTISVATRGPWLRQPNPTAPGSERPTVIEVFLIGSIKADFVFLRMRSLPALIWLNSLHHLFVSSSVLILFFYLLMMVCTFCSVDLENESVMSLTSVKDRLSAISRRLSGVSGRVSRRFSSQNSKLVQHLHRRPPLHDETNTIGVFLYRLY